MQKQKRGFWLFIFSLIPGAGEMYMGFKKQGISIMFLFWGVFAIGACTGMDWLVFLIPIIWFYSFFNVHNLKSLSEEEFYSIEDSYVLHMDELAGDISSLLKHHGKITAILLIFLGASILWNQMIGIRNTSQSIPVHAPMAKTPQNKNIILIPCFLNPMYISPAPGIREKIKSQNPRFCFCILLFASIH